MKKLMVIGAMTLAALMLALGFAPTASAYPQTSCSVSVNAQKILGGSKLAVSGQAATTVTDDGLGRAAATTNSWRAEFNGNVKTVQSNALNVQFNVPEVQETTVLVLKVSVNTPNVAEACQQSINITVEPGGTVVTPPGNLPNTGGPRLSLLIGGLGLVAAGGVAIRQSRRRHDELYGV